MTDCNRLDTVLPHSLLITCRVKHHSSLIFGVLHIGVSKVKKSEFSFNVSVSLCHLSKIQECLSMRVSWHQEVTIPHCVYCPSHCSMFSLSQLLSSKSSSASVSMKIRKFTNLHFWFVGIIKRKCYIISITMLFNICARCFMNQLIHLAKDFYQAYRGKSKHQL